MKNPKIKLMKRASFFLLAIMTISFACKNTEKFEGYELIEKRFVKEVNADVYYLKHIKSGGHVVKIAADDKNKTFGIYTRKLQLNRSTGYLTTGYINFLTKETQACLQTILNQLFSD